MPWFISSSAGLGCVSLGALPDTAPVSACIHFLSLACWALILTRCNQIHFPVALALCPHMSCVSVFWVSSILPDTGVFCFCWVTFSMWFLVMFFFMLNSFLFSFLCKTMSSQRTQTDFYPKACMRASLSCAFNGARINEACVCGIYVVKDDGGGWLKHCAKEDLFQQLFTCLPRAKRWWEVQFLPSCVFWPWWRKKSKYLHEYLIAHIMSTVEEVTWLLFGENNGLWRSGFW